MSAQTPYCPLRTQLCVYWAVASEIILVMQIVYAKDMPMVRGTNDFTTAHLMLVVDNGVVVAYGTANHQLTVGMIGTRKDLREQGLQRRLEDAARAFLDLGEGQDFTHDGHLFPDGVSKAEHRQIKKHPDADSEDCGGRDIAERRVEQRLDHFQGLYDSRRDDFSKLADW